MPGLPRPRIVPFLACFALSYASAAAAQPAADSAQPVPIHLASGKVHVQVAVGDAEPAWFLLDSGANMTILDLDLARRLELPLRGHATGDRAAGGGTFEVRFADVPSLRIGEVEIPGRTVAVLDRRTQGANGHPSFGLLGANVFRSFVVEVDYPARTLTLHDAERFEYRGDGSVLPVRLDENGKWHLEGRIVLPAPSRETLEATFVLDTGGRGFLTLNRPFVEKHGLTGKLQATAEATVGVGIGGEVRHHVTRLAEVAVGPVRFPSPPVDYPPAGAGGAFARGDRDGLLGARFLQPFRAFFDAARSRLILERRREIGVLPYDASGLFLQAAGPELDALEVLGVAPGSPAHQAGLERGDRLLAVDGRPAQELTLDEARARLMEAGRHVTLRLERESRVFERRMALRPIRAWQTRATPH